jgi:hypothetical protein
MANSAEGITESSIRSPYMAIGRVSRKRCRYPGAVDLLDLVLDGSSCTYENLPTEQIERSQVPAQRFHLRSVFRCCMSWMPCIDT